MQRPEHPPGSRTFLNCGAGPRGNSIPEYFEAWREIRIDLEPKADPDVVASITDLSEIPDGVADAVFTSHCLEHLFLHQVPAALAEFRRVLNDGGFLCLRVPDLQAVAERIAADQLAEVAYESPAGPVTPHDMVYGFSPALARGHVHMAHRCGFTRTVMAQRLREAGFTDLLLRRNPKTIELNVLAARTTFGGPERLSALTVGLGL
ncbi:MAG TPA: methyltransferase domain-containing protein [Stellaceae bacterium]|nr:methyltransferase domain-containing protein [Stellaceae bacterium]